MLPSILCCLSLSFRACLPEVTVTSLYTLHPPRLCRIAVLLVKPIVSLSMSILKPTAGGGAGLDVALYSLLSFFVLPCVSP